MKRSFLIICFSFFSFACFSQEKEIVGDWVWQDSVNKIQLFINKNGTIQQFSGLLSDYRWYRDDRRGTYTFNKGILSITWRDESIESWKLTFKNQFKAAVIQCTTPKDKVKKKCLFVKVIDEEVRPEEVN